MQKIFFILVVILIFASGCSGAAWGQPSSDAEVTALLANEGGSSATPLATRTLLSPVTATKPVLSLNRGAAPPAHTALAPTIETAVSTGDVGEAAASPTPSPAAETPQSYARSVVDPIAVSFELEHAVPPIRDNARLAAAFNGYDPASLNTPIALLTQPHAVGDQDTYNVLDVVNNSYGEIEAELMAVGEHAYFWFETGQYGLNPDPSELSSTAARFDEVYQAVTGLFGTEASPGVDGDARLHVLNASPQTICGVTAGDAGKCGIAGYVSFADLLPAALDPKSNEREMFLMNSEFFGSDYYLGVLAHEFRHLIETNYSEADTDWEKEGSAVLASQLAGLPNSSIPRANDFLAHPDQQLNSWPETGISSYYGQGYLFNQYIYDQLGSELYREFATNPLPGLVAIDAIAAEHQLGTTGEAMWLDWQAALVLHDHSRAPAKYRINVEGLDTAAVTSLNAPVGIEFEEVRQYAADFYELPLSAVRIDFAGTDTIPLLTGEQTADNVFWVAQRANYSNPRLTRPIDLRSVDAATLTYDVYADIEGGYDFAYVSASVDGEDWIPLTASGMKGLDAADDPSGSALAPRFYTGRDQVWRHENIDLTPFAGQEILLRFEIVTDPIRTYSGLAVDNIAVPAIGFADDESGTGWEAEGFTLAGALLPHSWRLQLVTFDEDAPVVEQIEVAPSGHAIFSTRGGGQRRPLLIVSSTVPMTLSPSSYSLRISELAE